MKRTTLCPEKIYQYADEFSESALVAKRRGRPRKYDEALILTIAAVQNLYSFSFREALEFVEPTFREKPCLSTFHYRVSHLSTETVEAFLTFLGMRLQGTFAKAGIPLKRYIVDGTGWSFHDIYPLNFKRGSEVRKAQAHVRALALVATTGRQRFVIGAHAGGPYASEVVLAKQLVARYSFKQKLPFLGDKAFDAIEFLQLIKTQGCTPAISMKETFRHEIRNPEREQSARKEKRYGKKRTLIEGLFGNVKEKDHSHIRVFDQHIAQTYGLLRLALYDMGLLVTFEREGVVWVWVFRTGSVPP